VTASDVQRTDPPQVGDERTLLDAFLDYHRETLLWKCSGLSDDQLRQRSAPPSTLSLLGLVRHLTEVERSWFRHGVAGQDVARLYFSDDNLDGDFDDVDSADAAANLAAYRAEIEQVRKAVADRSLDDTFTNRRGRTISLRWVYLHMLEEYARHNGHADLLRERIDGATGE
jgi:uncharacterized damage-inducible protein DinB